MLATGQPILRPHGYFAPRSQPQRSYAAALRARLRAQGMYLSADTPSALGALAPRSTARTLLLVGGNGHIDRPTASEAPVEDLVRWALDQFGGEVTHTLVGARTTSSVTGAALRRARCCPATSGLGRRPASTSGASPTRRAAALLLSKSILAADGAGERAAWHRAFSS